MNKRKLSGLQSLAMPTLASKLTHCRGIRRIYLKANMPAREQAPGSQFVSSVHGSLLRTI